jgi:hypothetical protein
MGRVSETIMKYINKYAFSAEMERSIQFFMAMMINIIEFKHMKSGTSFAVLGGDLESSTHREQDKWQRYRMEKEARET